jgi:hypothetical protein
MLSARKIRAATAPRDGKYMSISYAPALREQKIMQHSGALVHFQGKSKNEKRMPPIHRMTSF